MKHTLKKSLALFLAVLMAVLCAPLAFADDVVTGDCGDHVTYTWNKGTGAVTISGSGPMWDYDDDDWNNPSPFNKSLNVRAIVIESGVTSVGEYACRFCIYLQDVSFPYGLETIGKGAFLSTGLKNASLPRTVTRIGELALLSADLVSATLPKGLPASQNSAFFNNEDLQTLNYTGSPADWDAITIGEDAFENTPLSAPTCYYYGVDGAMNAIDAIGENDGSDAHLARIAVAAVANMNLTDAEKDMLTNVDVLHDAIRTVPDYSFDVVCGDLVGSAINWSTHEVIIGGFGPMRNDAALQSFFEDNPKYVKTLAVTEGVTGVATRMFKNCDQLESVTLPMSMKTIDQRAFAGCRHLNTINYPGGPADWNKIIIAADAFESAPVSEPTCYYYGVEGAMNAIDDIGDVKYTDECKARIDEARKAYDRLSDYETTLVTNYAALTKAEEDYAALETAALLAAAKTAAKEELAAYKNADDYRDAQKTVLAEAIAAGETAIDAATNSDAVATALAAAKTAIDAIKTDAELTAEEETAAAAAAAANQAAADAVEAKIAAIGKVTYTAACKTKIDDAQAAFDALTDAQKALVENKGTLDAAAKKYAELKAEAEKPTEPDEPEEPTEPEEENDKLANILTAVMELVKFVILQLIPFLVSLA